MSVPVVDWPPMVPACVLPLSPSGGLVDNRLSFETDDKMPPIERPLSSWTPDVYSVQLAPISRDQFVLFEEWYKRDLAFGVYPFKFKHPITGVLSAWKIVKANPPYSVGKSRRMRAGSSTRGVALSFSIMAWPASFEPTYVLQEQSDDVLQEQSDQIVETEGYTFSG